MKKTLVILAAGMASRYGGNKQVDGFGPNQETILEYSIYDAVKAGFEKVCFIIRAEHEELFRTKIVGDRISGKVEVVYAFQNSDLTEYGISETIERAKPWGTGHALLAARNLVDSPFCVINADDFYSSLAFELMSEFLDQRVNAEQGSLLGYAIGRTLSDSGPVTRGVCEVDADGNLVRLDERAKVYRDEKGQIIYEQENGEPGFLPDDAPVSMNFWGFTPQIFNNLEPMFVDFAKANKENPKAEFLIPEAAQALLESGKMSFEVIKVDAPCFGVTYKEDKELVKSNLAELVRTKTYPEQLWG